MWTRLKSLGLTIAFSLACLSASNTLAAPLVTLENPDKNEVSTGVIVLFGWTIDLVEIESVKIRVDGSDDAVMELGYGAERADVAAAFPEEAWFDTLHSGFAAAIGTENLKNGRHKIEIMVENENDETTVLTSHFVVSNPPGRKGPRDDMDISGAIITIDGQNIIMDNVIINGVIWDGIIFSFDPTSNSFRLSGAVDDEDFDGIHDDEDEDEDEDEDDMS